MSKPYKEVLTDSGVYFRKTSEGYYQPKTNTKLTPKQFKHYVDKYSGGKYSDARDCSDQFNHIVRKKEGLE